MKSQAQHLELTHNPPAAWKPRVRRDSSEGPPLHHFPPQTHASTHLPSRTGTRTSTRSPSRRTRSSPEKAAQAREAPSRPRRQPRTQTADPTTRDVRGPLMPARCGLRTGVRRLRARRGRRLVEVGVGVLVRVGGGV